MRLYEHEGKILFEKVGIRIPSGLLLDSDKDPGMVDDGVWPKVIKAQTLKGGRGKAGAIAFPENLEKLRKTIASMLNSSIADEKITHVLVEEKLPIKKEHFLSITYRNDYPVVIFSRTGGVDVEEISRKTPESVVVEPIDMTAGLEPKQSHRILHRAGVRGDVEELVDMMLKLYKCFYMNDALLMEINPLILTKEGHYVAADSKVELDDDTRYRQKSLSLPERRDSTRKTTSLELLALKNDQRDTRGAAGRMFYEIPDGDIIVLASGGGTSSEALDSLYLHHGRPAIFTEYSGNPTGEKVKGLTKIALSYPGEIHGVWVVGGRANFTDIYETLVNGIMAGIRETTDFDKRIPIVIRRAGLRDMEAFYALRRVREMEGYNLFLRGMETTINDSARMIIHHVNNHKRLLKEEKHGAAHK